MAYHARGAALLATVIASDGGIVGADAVRPRRGAVANVQVPVSPIHGRGVFARIGFSRGDRVLTIDDSRMVTETAPLRESDGEYPHHCDYLANGTVILMQPPERYINHCCAPNTFVKTVRGVRHVIARREIAAGEEIT